MGAAGSETVLDSSTYNHHATNSGGDFNSAYGFNSSGGFQFIRANADDLSIPTTTELQNTTPLLLT